MAVKLKNDVTASFKMHGFTLRGDASRYVMDVLVGIPDEKRSECIEKLVDAIERQQLQSCMIDRQSCEIAVQDCNAQQEEGTDVILNIVDAFQVPRFSYHTERNKFLPSSDQSTPCLLGEAHTKIDLFRERYTILQQRTSRHELFSPAAIGFHPSVQGKKFQVKPVEFLLGSTAKLGDIIVLGMLIQMKEGKWFLEDDTGVVQLDLTRANFHSGLFTENCFVLAEGCYDDQIFHVNAFGFPPAEPAATTRAYFGNINFFGGPSDTCAKASSKLLNIEKSNGDAMFVFISDVWLDNDNVMSKFRTLLSGYSEAPPTAFVLTGNFLSRPYGGKQVSILTEKFNELSDTIAQYPIFLSMTKFIFIAGPQDPGPAKILPYPQLPHIITSTFQEKIPSAIFTTNPCRIQYCTQEIVILREDIVMKMCRNCVRFPADADIPTHFAKTLVCQGHLCALPLHVAPIYWPYDHALRLYPLPDLIVCADKYEPFTIEDTGCIITNPGSFPRNGFSFKVYLPATKQVEDSQLCSDETVEEEN